MKIQNLEHKSLKLRRETFLAFIKKGEAHLGGSFSMIEILVFLHEKVLKKKDKFILSKSHASFPFSILLRSKGLNTKITTHLELDPKNGIYCTTGSLGHGLPIAAGMAFAKKIKREKGDIYVMISDGECQEGTTWESLLFASHHKLDNLVAIIDRNKLQSIYSTEDTMSLEPFVSKWESFGWNVVDIDGHDHNQLLNAFDNSIDSKPLCIVANTIKGKGVSFMENNTLWHYRSPQGKEYEAAMNELENA